MKHTTLSGHPGVFPLDAEAHQQLVDYLARARAAVDSEADGDETIRDLEMSIGDRLRTILDNGAALVDAADMAQVLQQAGPVHEEGTRHAPARAPYLCRIQEGKWFGGLCLGLATRSQLDIGWVRTIAILLLLFTGGTLGVAYLVALPFAPRVESVDAYERQFGRGSQPRAA